MKLVERIDAMVELGKYLKTPPPEWQEAKQKAFEANGWFTNEFVDLATENIISQFLQEEKLYEWAKYYYLDDNIKPKNIGIVMAGNIPMVGFHDMLCVFISGHKQTIKFSSKDTFLLKHIIETLAIQTPQSQLYFTVADMLKGCDAYIATGSNNSSRYFEQYFGAYPNIIRRNRTSVAILTGDESAAQLEKLADDVHLYFGLGCRNVTKLYVPVNYDFIPLLNAFRKYNYMQDHPKYKNNYDYYLALQIMNNRYYMTNDTIVLTEDEQPFSAISILHYAYYSNLASLVKTLENDINIQCIVGQGMTEFGKSQSPGLFTYADGTDTMQFLLSL